MIPQQPTEDLVIEEFGPTDEWTASAEPMLCFVCWRDSARPDVAGLAVAA